MIISYKGKGIFALLLSALGFLVPPVITKFTIADPYFATNNIWVMGLGLITAGILIMFMGRGLSKKEHHLYHFSITAVGRVDIIIGILFIVFPFFK